MTRYRFRTPSGETYESERTPAQIRKRHPGAVITHRVVMDELGQGTLAPYSGENPSDVPQEAIPEPVASDSGASGPLTASVPDRTTGAEKRSRKG